MNYEDTQTVNQLIAEQTQIQLALDILADNGTVKFVVVAATEDSTNPAAMPVQCAITEAPQNMIAGVTAGLRKRYNDINKELEDLGVTGLPEDHR